MEEPLLTFVVINRNGNHEVIMKCLQAINRISHLKTELLFVDDCSHEELPHDIFLSVNRVIRNKKHRGIGFSRNRGLRASKGDVIFFIDSDIEIKELCVSDILSYFSRDEALVGICGQYKTNACRDLNNVLDLRREAIYLKATRPFFYGCDRLYTTFSGGFSVLNKRRVGRLKQRWNKYRSGEDIHFQLSLLDKGFRFGYVPSMVGIHHHERGFKEGVRKGIKEAQGRAWIVSQAFATNLKVPVLEGVLIFPFFLVIGLLLSTPALALLEMLPYLLLILKRRNIVSLELFFYEVWCSLVSILYFTAYLWDGRLTGKTRLRYILFLIYSSPLAKYSWFLNTFRSRVAN